MICRHAVSHSVPKESRKVSPHADARKVAREWRHTSPPALRAMPEDIMARGRGRAGRAVTRVHSPRSCFRKRSDELAVLLIAGVPGLLEPGREVG